MPNIATLFKAEITRIARKEVRAQTTTLKRAASSYRHDIAALKKRLSALESALKRAQRASGARTAAPASESDEGASGLRFQAKGLVSLRERHGLSRDQLGALLGVSGQTIYLWEMRGVKPKPKYLPTISELRSLGKKALAARLEQVQPG